jgi:hypothetical protein
MAGESKTATSSRLEQRRQRLAAELRSNLLKRKEQARARSAAAGPNEAEKPPKPDG